MKSRTLQSLAIVAVAGVLFVALGCFESTASEPAKQDPLVVVVDLDEIGKALGLQEEVAAQIRNDEQMLLNRRQQIIAQMQTQIQEKRAEFGEELTEEQQRELAQMNAQAQGIVNQINREIQGLAMRNRQVKVAQVREQIKPFVERIARRHNAKIVAEKANLFWSDDELDISGDVIAELKLEADRIRDDVKKSMQSQPVPAPADTATEAPDETTSP